MIDSGVSLVILCICGTDAGFGLEILGVWLCCTGAGVHRYQAQTIYFSVNREQAFKLQSTANRETEQRGRNLSNVLSVFWSS